MRFTNHKFPECSFAAMPIDLTSEWLEADGLGGFASGTVSGIRTRRYHALLLPATTPPTGRMVFVNGFDAWVRTPRGLFAISSQMYPADVFHPDGVERIRRFEYRPWPSWEFQIEEGLRVRQEIFVPRGRSMVIVRWRALNPATQATLTLRPFLSGRDYHVLQRENSDFSGASTIQLPEVVWRPYANLPPVIAFTNGGYQAEVAWYKNFLYEEERRRGMDFLEDLASPGQFSWELSDSEAVLILASGDHWRGALRDAEAVSTHAEELRMREQDRRAQFSHPLHLSADAYIVARNTGKTIIAGYPWFTDWGRDTFIALRGLCIATGRLADLALIFRQWLGHVSQGMLPNRFPDLGAEPEFNSVDASLWFIVAAQEFLTSWQRRYGSESPLRPELHSAMEAILTGYRDGTRYGIQMDADSLIRAGQPGVALTWMDAIVAGKPVTPRIGKPVEVQALWINALRIVANFSTSWEPVYKSALDAFTEKFWDEEAGHLHDVIDADHEPGKVDSTFRINQIFAVGGLPLKLFKGDQACRIVDEVERRLWTPLGMRTLAPGEPGYMSQYEGAVAVRDGAYHQGTVWPWLIGPFAEAWLRTRENTPEIRAQAAVQFLQTFHDHLNGSGLGHISEILDADPPHTPKGCPFQAWSLGEYLRLQKLLS